MFNEGERSQPSSETPIPKVLGYLVDTLNQLNLVDIINSHIKYRVVRKSTKYNKQFKKK